MWQTKGLQEGVFGSVASKGLTGRCLGSVASTGLRGDLKEAESRKKRDEKDGAARSHKTKKMIRLNPPRQPVTASGVAPNQ